MARRFPTAERREQIVLATLGLLAHLPMAQVTTRRIAREVGISQPALFRHFDTRDAILAAVVAHSRAALREAADGVLAGGADWAGAAEQLAAAVAAHVQRHPGLPRLLFHDLASGDRSTPSRSLRGLVDMQAGLVAGLVQQGQRAGDIPETVDARAAGQTFVALIQGSIAGWLAEPRPDLSTARVAARVWVAAVRAGEPRGAPVADASGGTEALVALDVRPILARGEEPLDAILEGLDRVVDDGLLLLAAPFRPGPLLTLLEGRGFVVDAVEQGPGHWEVEVRGPGCPAPLDLRQLPTPEPLEAVLLAVGRLGPGEVVVARVPRVPRLLLPRLAERGLEVAFVERPEGTAVLHARRPR